MKLVSYLNGNGDEKLGLFYDEKVIPLRDNAKDMGFDLPESINPFLQNFSENASKARMIETELKRGNIKVVENKNTIRMLSPVPHPMSCRDAYAFRQHVATARRNRGVDMIPEFDLFPVFYFTNHNAIIGGGDIVIEDDHLLKLDFELEAAVVIGRKGRNIVAAEADSFIAGLTIMNDFSARVLQMEEMKLNLGPAKGKDFATAIGPWLVTLDELEPYRVSTLNGSQYDLPMAAFHNGEKISEGNLKDMDWTFAEIIERASYGVDLYPGDVIGSGTVGTGCYLELNGSRTLEARDKGESYTPVWLQEGDEIRLEIEGLGSLANTIVRSGYAYSILDKKKNV